MFSTAAICVCSRCTTRPSDYYYVSTGKNPNEEIYEVRENQNDKREKRGEWESRAAFFSQRVEVGNISNPRVLSDMGLAIPTLVLGTFRLT